MITLRELIFKPGFHFQDEIAEMTKCTSHLYQTQYIGFMG